MMNMGIIEILVNSLRRFSSEERAVRNIIFALGQFTYSNQTRKHLESQEGIFELVILAMQSSWSDRVRQFGWTLLSNCAGASPKSLEAILQAGVLNTFFRAIQDKGDASPDILFQLENFCKDESIKANLKMIDPQYKPLLLSTAKQLKAKTPPTHPLLHALVKLFEQPPPS